MEKINKIKVATIVGTRPELIKLSAVIKKLDLFTDHILIHTGQNYDYELNEIFFEDLNIRKPDFFLNSADENLGSSIGNIISKSFEILNDIKPEALLIYGDTNSCLSAISAKRLKIPIFHMEAGNRCFDQRVPEEINRKIIDHISDINFTISENAQKYLISEGIPANQVIKVGSSMEEVLRNQKDKIDQSIILERLNLETKSYFIVSLHREENVDNEQNLKLIIESLLLAKSVFKRHIIFSVHPRTKKRLEKLNLIKTSGSNIHFLKPLGFNDYIRLQKDAFCVISDSGTVFEESSLLGVPAITIRESSERPEAFEEGVVIMTGLKKENIINSINVAVNLNKFKPVKDYTAKHLSDKIVKLIITHIPYVNKFLWKK